MSNNKNSTVSEILAYITVFFLLLAALFGGQIMTFIFGVLGPDAAGLDSTDAAYNASLEIQNNSLQAIVVYSEGSSNQMNVVTIAIILILLIGVFLLFWNRFIKDNIGGKSGMNFGA
jgi:cobalamin synthase